MVAARATASRVSRVRGWTVSWLGTTQGMENRLVPPSGIEMDTIGFSGLRGKGLLRLALLPLQLLVAFWQSARAIFSHRPDVVLGMGGYVSFPGGMMASLLNRPLAIHEQNSIAGLANRVLDLSGDGRGSGKPFVFQGTYVEWVERTGHEAPGVHR